MADLYNLVLVICTTTPPCRLPKILEPASEYGTLALTIPFAGELRTLDVIPISTHQYHPLQELHRVSHSPLFSCLEFSSTLL